MAKKQEVRKAAARRSLQPLFERCEGVLAEQGQVNITDFGKPVVQAFLGSGVEVLRRNTDGGVEVVADYTRIAADGVPVLQHVEVTFPLPGDDLANTHIYAEARDSAGVSYGPQGLRRYPEFANAILDLMR